MAKLREEFFDKIAVKVIKEGDPDDLAKFMLSGKEHIEAVQRYFYNLEADKKEKLIMKGDEWSLGDIHSFEDKIHTGLPLFKLFASSIIPYVEKLHIINTHLKGYSFLNDIKNLNLLELEFADENEHTKVLAGLSSLQSAHFLELNIKGLDLQLLSSLPFLFNDLTAYNFIFEADPKCDKMFQATQVVLYGNEERMNDFVFGRQNYQSYADLFPNAYSLFFDFYIKIVDDISDLLKVSSPNHSDEVEVADRHISITYHFYDHSGYPDSKVLRMLQNDERWDTDYCPYNNAGTESRDVEVICIFPLAGPAIGNILAEQSLRRVPENIYVNLDYEYYRLTIENSWGHKARFDVLENLLVKDLLKAYGEITGLDYRRLHFVVGFHEISHGIVADWFQDSDVIFIRCG